MPLIPEPPVNHQPAANGKFASAGQTRPRAPPVPPRAVLAVHARGTHGREEEEDVAREGEMAAENKPEGKRKIMFSLFVVAESCHSALRRSRGGPEEPRGRRRGGRRNRGTAFRIFLSVPKRRILVLNQRPWSLVYRQHHGGQLTCQ